MAGNYFVGFGSEAALSAVFVCGGGGIFEEVDWDLGCIHSN